MREKDWQKEKSVVLVDEVDNDFDHCVFLFGAAFGDHQGKGYEGVVGDAFGAVFVVEYAISIYYCPLNHKRVSPTS